VKKFVYLILAITVSLVVTGCKNELFESSKIESVSSCSHKETCEVCMTDLRKYENIKSSSVHNVIDRVELRCKSCDEFVGYENRTSSESHNWKDDVCTLCGYTVKSSSANIVKGTSVYVKDLSIKNQYADGMNSSVSVSDEKGLKFKIDMSSKNNENLPIGNESINFVEYDVTQYSRLTTTVRGVNAETALRIYGDGELIYQTPMFKTMSDPVNIDVDISKFKILRLEAYGIAENSSKVGNLITEETKVFV